MYKRLIVKTVSFLLPSLLIVPSTASAAIADTPLFANTAVQPNIFFLVDDSGSMGWAVLKSTGAVNDAVYGDTDDFPGEGINNGAIDMSPDETNWAEVLEACSGFNVLYYDPNEIYSPWVGEDINGDTYADQSITSARVNPYDPSDGVVNINAIFGGLPGYFTWNDANSNGVFERGECPV
jgi:type IV pilus assembly protein PilY1